MAAFCSVRAWPPRRPGRATAVGSRGPPPAVNHVRHGGGGSKETLHGWPAGRLYRRLGKGSAACDG